MTAGERLELAVPIQRMLELEHAEKVVRAMASGKLPGLTDAELRAITDTAGEDASLFDPDTLELDGWRQDHNRSWVPPDIYAIDAAPDRGQGMQLQPRPAPGSASGTPGGSSSTAAQKLAELTPTQFLAECEAIRNDELRKRWANDRENWIHRCLSERVKSGHLWTPQIRPFRRPETGVEFYFTASCVCKVVWILVRQLRGPHFSTCA